MKTGLFDFLLEMRKEYIVKKIFAKTNKHKSAVFVVFYRININILLNINLHF